jgi:hypothetical protein
MRSANEDKSAADRRRDVVGVRRSGAKALAVERAGDECFDRHAEVEERIDGDDRGRGARRAPSETARERQSLANAKSHAAPLTHEVQQRLRRDPGGVPCGVSRQPSRVARDVVDADAGRCRSCGHLVARGGQRKPQHVESAGDIRHGRRRKRGHRFHRADRFYSTLNFDVRSSNLEVRIRSLKFDVRSSESLEFEVRSESVELQTSNFRLRTSNVEVHNSDFR